MKTLRKLKINPEKILLNEELTRLRGGGDPCTCLCWKEGQIYGYLFSPTGDCDEDCSYVWPDSTGACLN